MGVAIRCRVRVISVDQVSVGYARCKGLKYAFGELEADCAFMGDDDLHTPPQGIPLLYAGIEKGNDLVIGHRSFRSFITHPPLQVILESGFNLAACTRALALPTDLISGSAAFSREGWMKIDPFLTEEVMRNVRTGVPFLLPVYKSLGLGVCSIPVPGPYEGSYFRDSLDLGYIRRRLRSIRADYIDVERGIRFAREISVRTQGA